MALHHHERHMPYGCIHMTLEGHGVAFRPLTWVWPEGINAGQRLLCHTVVDSALTDCCHGGRCFSRRGTGALLAPESNVYAGASG